MWGIAWQEPAWYLWSLFVIATVGLLLPIRLEGREDHIVFTIGASVVAAILGPRAFYLLFGAVLVAVPCVFVWNAIGPKQMRRGIRGSLRSAGWIVVSAFACTVGFLAANAVYAGVFGRDYPIVLDTTTEMAVAGIAATVAWVGTMSVRVMSQRLISRSLIAQGLDPIDSPLIPYLLPLIGGFPLITASVAMYRPADPFPSLFILWWCIPVYAATALDLRRRHLAQELRRDAIAKQRLAAIGEVSARIVHQSRHQVGLMGWSIHRLRGLIGRTDPVAIAAANAELDALTEAKDQLSEMLAAELLHEAPRREEGPGEEIGATRAEPLASPTNDHGENGPQGLTGPTGPTGPSRMTVVELVRSVAEQLRDEADREGVALRVEIAAPNGSSPAARQLRDVVFNLVDNAIDAASSEVVVHLVEHHGSGGGLTISVVDDGPGLATGAERIFQPFVTTKSDGTGMSLALADALVGDLSRQLTYDRADGRTRFVVSLPVSEAPSVR